MTPWQRRQRADWWFYLAESLRRTADTLAVMTLVSFLVGLFGRGGIYQGMMFMVSPCITGISVLFLIEIAARVGRYHLWQKSKGR